MRRAPSSYEEHCVCMHNGSPSVTDTFTTVPQPQLQDRGSRREEVGWDWGDHGNLSDQHEGEPGAGPPASVTVRLMGVLGTLVG